MKASTNGRAITTITDVITVETDYSSVLDFELRPIRIIYSYPATIVFWNDGTKTVVRACTGFDRNGNWVGGKDEYTVHGGFAAALAKKMFGGVNTAKYEHLVTNVSDFSQIVPPPLPADKPTDEAAEEVEPSKKKKEKK